MSGKRPEKGLQDGAGYAGYLALDAILGAQHPRTDTHDEMLFIVQHQTSELWMKLAIHELQAARAALEAGQLEPMFKMLARVSRIFEQLNGAWDVLRTMTPAEYTRFRPALGGASGFQSAQYRMIEFILGNRDPAMLALHAGAPAQQAALAAELDRPSLYDAAIALLFARTPGPGAPPAARVEGKGGDGEGHRPEVLARWRVVYEDVERHWALYELAEKLVDLEDYFRRWRFNHVTTVERIIGLKRGTGGTSGVPYLRRMLAVELFPELWRLRGAL